MSIHSISSTAELKNCYSIAKNHFHTSNPLLNKESELKTIEAAKHFFKKLYEILSDENRYPFINCNKCLGMVVVPQTNLVLISVSEDRNPNLDDERRKNFLKLIIQVNELTNQWKYELVYRPNLSEYLMLRALTLAQYDISVDQLPKARTRCAEVALAFALFKVGRFKSFSKSSIGIVTFGATLWSSKEGDSAINYFSEKKRNRKYTLTDPIEVPLKEGGIGWIDRWSPCKEHCLPYMDAMLTIATSGKPGISLKTPRSESSF